MAGGVAGKAVKDQPVELGTDRVVVDAARKADLAELAAQAQELKMGYE